MNEISKSQFTEEELEELDPWNEDHWKLWAYDEDCHFYNECEINPVGFIDLLDRAVQYALDPKCVKLETIWVALLELTREAYRDRNYESILKLSNAIKNIKSDSVLKGWRDYVEWFNNKYYYSGEVCKSDAIKLCQCLIEPLPCIAHLINVYSITYNYSYTGKKISNYHEIMILEDLPDHALKIPEYVYVDLERLDWKYSFRDSLEIID